MGTGGEIDIYFKRRNLLFKFICLRQVFPRRSLRREGGQERNGQFPADFNFASPLPPVSCWREILKLLDGQIFLTLTSQISSC